MCRVDFEEQSVAPHIGFRYSPMGVRLFITTAVTTLLSAVAIAIWVLVVEMALTTPTVMNIRKATTPREERSTPKSGITPATEDHKLDEEMDRRFKAEFQAIFMPSAELFDDAIVREGRDLLGSIWRGEYL